MSVSSLVVDPKRALTRLRDRHPLAMSVAFSDREHDVIGKLAGRFSITTVEELVALASVSGDLLDGLDLGPTLTDLVEHFRASPAGIAQTADWPRYDERVYATGCALDLATPPADAPSDVP